MELSVHKVTKTYGEKTALFQIDFALTPGVYGLLGPNGAGKTTLMNILAGNLKPSSGGVYYNGKPTAEQGDSFRQILGYMPQQQALYPDFTAERFLYYIAALRGLDRKRASAQIDWAIEQVDLKEHIRKRIGAMSGGMKQRLLIAQAILHEPEVLILDEPTAGLDPNQRIAVRNLIGKLAGERVIIISTHVVPDVEYITNKLLLIKEGKLIAATDRNTLLESLKGKVFEVAVPPELVEDISTQYCVSNILQDGNVVRMRIVSETRLPYISVDRPPTLDDVCLMYFGEEQYDSI